MMSVLTATWLFSTPEISHGLANAQGWCPPLVLLHQVVLYDQTAPNRQPMGQGQADYQAVKKWNQRFVPFNIFALEIALFPINVNMDHWVCIAADMSKRTPSGSMIPLTTMVMLGTNQYLDHVRSSYLEQEHLHQYSGAPLPADWRMVTGPAAVAPQQPNNSHRLWHVHLCFRRLPHEGPNPSLQTGPDPRPQGPHHPAPYPGIGPPLAGAISPCPPFVPTTVVEVASFIVVV
jgi:Ulp1 protease family, C-terminal catalytic domain